MTTVIMTAEEYYESIGYTVEPCEDITYDDICTSLDLREYWIQECRKIAKDCVESGNGVIDYALFNSRCADAFDKVAFDFPELGCFAEHNWGVKL